MEKRRKLSPSDPAGWLALSGFRLASAFASRLFPEFKGGADHKTRLEYLILTCKILQLFNIFLLLSHTHNFVHVRPDIRILAARRKIPLLLGDFSAPSAGTTRQLWMRASLEALNQA